MNFEKLEAAAKLADASYPDWKAHPTEAGEVHRRTFSWLLNHKKGPYIPTLVADHIAAFSPVAVLNLIEEIRKRDALLERAKELATLVGMGTYDWTDHAAISYREVRVENEKIAEAAKWLADLKALE